MDLAADTTAAEAETMQEAADNQNIMESCAGEETASEELRQDNETEQEQMCFVYVCGAVSTPGVYEIDPKARIVDAVVIAGGFTDDADRDYLNLAGMICDGMKIYVPTEQEVREGYKEEPQVSGAAGMQLNSDGGNSTKPKVNINTADETALMTLKGVGESRAKDIIGYRDAHGGFNRIEDIMQVPGIKDGMFEKIKDDIEV